MFQTQISPLSQEPRRVATSLPVGITSITTVRHVSTYSCEWVGKGNTKFTCVMVFTTHLKLWMPQPVGGGDGGGGGA